jgi:hypothetical protein
MNHQEDRRYDLPSKDEGFPKSQSSSVGSLYLIVGFDSPRYERHSDGILYLVWFAVQSLPLARGELFNSFRRIEAIGQIDSFTNLRRR